MQGLSTPQRDLHNEGYVADAPLEDLQSPAAELNVMRQITDELSRCLTSPEATVRAILAARSFERMGAHAANVAETVVFVVKGAALSKECQP